MPGAQFEILVDGTRAHIATATMSPSPLLNFSSTGIHKITQILVLSAGTARSTS